MQPSVHFVNPLIKIITYRSKVIEIRNYYLSETNFVKGIFSFRLSSMKFRFEPFTI